MRACRGNSREPRDLSDIVSPGCLPGLVPCARAESAEHARERGGLDRVGRRRAREMTNHLAGGVDELEPKAVARVDRGGEPVVDDDARRRVLAGGRREEVSAGESDGGVRREEMDGRATHAVGQRAQRRNIIEHPHRSAVRRRDEIASLHLEVSHRCAGKVELQRLPVRAVVGRVVDAGFGAGVQEPAPHGIFANGSRVGAVGNAGVDRGPRAAEVGSLI